ncbi:MAG: DUF5688 family protein [Clostridiales bacterium]|nr:DUF5688 family protein [Clostridiales bacterium]
MLKYDNFKKEVIKTIGSYMPENYKNLALKEVKIDKINQTVEGFCFADENKEMTASAVIYFKDMYSKYLSTGDIKAVLTEAAKTITYYDSKAGSINTPTAVLIADMVKNNTVMLLINADMNKELLTQVPCFPFLDLAIVFRCFSELLLDAKAPTASDIFPIPNRKSKQPLLRSHNNKSPCRSLKPVNRGSLHLCQREHKTHPPHAF